MVSKDVQQKVESPTAAILPEELEYMVALIDRSCCHPDLALNVQEQLAKLLFLLPAKAETMNAQLLSLRALTHCALAKPTFLEEMAKEGPDCTQYVMALSLVLPVGSFTFFYRFIGILIGLFFRALEIQTS